MQIDMFIMDNVAKENKVKPVLETTCIKRLPPLRDQCSGTTLLLYST